MFTWKLRARRYNTGADTVDVNSVLNCYMTELQDTAPLQAQSALQFWLDCESSYQRLSQLLLDLVSSPASQALSSCSRCVMNWQQENVTEPKCPSIGVCFWNLTVISCIEQLTYGVKCEDVNWLLTLLRRVRHIDSLCFWVLIFTPTCLTIVSNCITINKTITKTKTTMRPKRKLELKQKWLCKTKTKT